MKLLSILFSLFFILAGCGDTGSKHKSSSEKPEKSCCTDTGCDSGCTDTSCTDCDCGDGGCDCGDSCACGGCPMETSAAATVTPWNLPQMNAPIGTYMSTEHSNGIFVIEAYFLSCPYCNDNAAAVNKLAEDYKDKYQVQVLDVGIDRNDSQYDTWISKHRINHPVLKDPSKSLLGQLGTSSYPSTYIVDCNMNILHSSVGVWSAAKIATIKSIIDDLLTKPCFLLREVK